MRGGERVSLLNSCPLTSLLQREGESAHKQVHALSFGPVVNYFFNGVSMVLSLCMMFLPLTVIPRWARVFLPGGQMQMSLIIRDDLEDNDEEIENGL